MMAFENLKKYTAMGASLALGAGALLLFADGKIDNCGKGIANVILPGDYEFDDAGLTDCLPDVPESVRDFFNWLADKFGDDDNDKDSEPYTSKVEGAITKIEINSLEWPLFTRAVTLNPLEVNQGGDVVYQESTLVRQGTAMVGKLASIVVGEGVDREAYIMAVDSNGNDDPSDDKMVPINVNDFDMVSYSYTNHTTFDAEATDDAVEKFQECNHKVLEGADEVGGCTLAGTNGHNETIDPVVLDNIRDQYLSDEKCTVDTMHIMSNLVLGGPSSPKDWTQIGTPTVTVSQISAASLNERMATLNGIAPEKTHIIMEIDPDTGKPVEWDAESTINLSEIVDLSGGKYEAPDVHVDSFCFSGSWSLDATPQEHLDYIRQEIGVGEEFFDPEWYKQFAYTPEPMPDFAATIQFNADGTWTPPTDNLPTGD
jgi:hypothetical protein